MDHLVRSPVGGPGRLFLVPLCRLRLRNLSHNLQSLDLDPLWVCGDGPGFFLPSQQTRNEYQDRCWRNRWHQTTPDLSHTFMFQTLNSWMYSNLSLGRIVRFGLSIWVAFEAWRTQEPMLGILAGILMLQVVTNTGCGLRGCQAPRKTEAGSDEDIECTEVQSK
jgi:hypothetical protein